MAEPEQQAIQKRQVAYKVRVKDILDGVYVKEEGWQPNYVDMEGGKVSRVNLIGTIVLKIDASNIVLDDGSGKIPLRVFENNVFFEKIDVGDVVLVIGKPREFGSEKYIMPEILRKVEDTGWIDVRKNELKLNKTPDINPKKEGKKDVEEIAEDVKEDPYEKVFNLIKKMDNGDGVDVEEVVNSIVGNDAEKIVQKLLENGEVFEVKRGKLKVLE